MLLDPDVALFFNSADEAIVYENIKFWVERNRIKNINYYDGCYWMYNTYESFAAQFKFFSVWKIRRIIRKLLKAKLIKKGRFNRRKYDCTNWYAMY